MADVVILGAGVMGTAFAYPLCDSGSVVDIVGTHLDREEIDGLRRDRRHPRLPTQVPQGLRAHHLEAFPELLSQRPALLILAVSSPGVEWAAATVADAITETERPCPPILMLTKGLDVSAGIPRPFPERVAEVLQRAGGREPSVGAVGGPCIAAELASRRHSGVVFGGSDAASLAEVASHFYAPYYHVQTTTDLVGLEVAAALKNFYTIGISAAGGNNPSAALFSQAVTEMARVAAALGGDPETVYGLPGVGDLYVTCQAGRNSRLGAHLGRGLRYSEARRKHMPEETVEGADLALSLGPLLRPGVDKSVFRGLRLPLGEAVIRAVCDDELFAVPWDTLPEVPHP